MKKILLILCACAILLSSAACSCDSDKPSATDETGEIETGEAVIDGTVIDPIPGTVDNSDDNNGDGNNKNNTPTVTPDTDVSSPEIITPGGTEPGLWPNESIPEDVPAYEDYSQMYNVTHDEHEESEEWYLSFDSTEKDFEAYLDKLRSEGYKESSKIYGFWGNGEQILNIFTEEVDGEFCVSIDIFKSKPVVYPDEVKNNFPEFTVSDSTLYGWYVVEGSPKKLSVSYACGENFAQDLSAYKTKLSEAGFTVTENQATLEKNGKTYTVRYGDDLDAYEDQLEYEFS